ICISSRRFRICALESQYNLLSSNISLPSLSAIKRSSMRPVVDLPQPDSPTRPNVSPFFNVKETPSTALTSPIFRPNTPPVMGKYFFRLSTSINVSVMTLPPVHFFHAGNSGLDDYLPFREAVA